VVLGQQPPPPSSLILIQFRTIEVSRLQLEPKNFNFSKFKQNIVIKFEFNLRNLKTFSIQIELINFLSSIEREKEDKESV